VPHIHIRRGNDNTFDMTTAEMNIDFDNFQTMRAQVCARPTFIPDTFRM
jgi:hypothetical protein